jgi:sulfur-oxidizing protein SoxX
MSPVFWLLLLALAVAVPASADEALETRVEQVMRDSFSGATPEEWRTRLEQDEVQRLCSRYRNQPPADVAAKISELSRARFRYPQNGNLLGDWKNGEKLASSGRGGHIGKIQPDPPGRKKGGNCYACHQLAKSEVAAGNLGPSLTHYADVRGTTPEAVKYVYQKIYNAEAFYPCSQMPPVNKE